MTQHQFWRSSLLIAVTAALFITSCKEKTDVVTPGTTNPAGATDSEVNNWILDNMSMYYYWNDRIPANPDKTLKPTDFFYSLLYDYENTANPERDRFSWIQESAAELSASLSGQTKTSGMEYQLSLRASGSTDVVGVVIYTLKGSPADRAGIKRGDIFYSVNGQNLTTSNYQTVLGGTTDTRTYGFATLNNRQITNTATTKQVTDVVFQENPVYFDSVYTIQGKKIGYLVYNQFIPGPRGADSLAYDRQIDAIFGKFKQQGVNELVLDLRYNPGGFTSSSIELASLIGKGVTPNTLFFRQDWNKTITPELQAYDRRNRTDSFNKYFV
ncbi:MAG: peptidase S41, partial [Bacteroidetes bacterium]|nr:peptidase S41 [Fibrella sp.]